jgi:Histidine kinase-, DNA gyrase B-, and HSP90-like ATPase
MARTGAPHSTTLPMTVKNMGFMLDRLGQDCAPLQYLRELTQNAVEAIRATPEKTGEIVWDVDWNRYTLSERFKLAVIDNGIGMTGEEMVRYINALSSSMYEQSATGNFGVGAKIAAATRNHAGMIYLSWKEGIGCMTHLWRDPESGEYGLQQFERPDGSFGHWAYISDDIKPAGIGAHGTMVVLLGDDVDADTVKAPDGTPAPSRWIGRYLNTRYFRFPDGITIKAREGWEFPRNDADRNLLRTVMGQGRYVGTHAESSGQVELSGATARWTVLKDEEALTQNSGYIASSGHMAALYHDELYEMVTGRAGTARLQLFGVIFGSNRVVIYVEPTSTPGRALTSNTARTQLLLNGEPLPWADWAAEFRANMPTEIARLMEQVTAGTVSSDHRQAIRERLRQIRDLFRLSRYRAAKSGDLAIDPESFVSGGKPRESEPRAHDGGGRGGGGAGGRAGDVYALFLMAGGTPGEQVRADPEPEVTWVTVAEKTRLAPDMEDRAGKYLFEQNRLLINGDFRVYTDMVERWCKTYSHAPGADSTVQEVVREWFEQALIETVLGVHALRDARYWTVENIKEALAQEALTAAVMPRYHIEMSVRRALGAKLGTVKDKAV